MYCFSIFIRTATTIKYCIVCNDYFEVHDLTFNAKKSMCMYFSIVINMQTLWTPNNIPGQLCMSICEGS